MNKFDGVANTLFVPLVARINISKKFPEYFMDEKALELEKYLPQGADKGSSEYSNMASVARYYNMDKTVTAFAKSYAESNIVYLGAGLETAYDRLSDKIENRTVHWYEADLPEVIEARKKVFGQRKNETLIAGDMFKLEWVKEIDNSLPTLLIVSGVFQYFHEEEIIAFIKGCGKAFPKGEMLFDATSESGLKFTNWFIKRTGNAVTVSFDGADMTTTILDVIECSSSSTFETALNATFGKHKAKEGVSAWIILDVMGGVGKGALIKKWNFGKLYNEKSCGTCIY